MAEDNVRNIPTLEDVVEVGNQDDENIVIVPQKDALDDAYDDEFNKLFDLSDDEHAAGFAVDVDVDMDDDISDELWDETAMQMVESHDPLPQQQDVTISTDTATTAEESEALQQLAVTASDQAVSLDAVDPDNDWIQDWQEEIVDSAAIENIGAGNLRSDDDSEAVEKDTAAGSDDVEITEPSTVVKAVASHETTADNDASPIKPASPVDPDSALGQAFADIDDIPQLVNDIVQQIMPEIEWKLKTRIREILEQRFTPED